MRTPTHIPCNGPPRGHSKGTAHSLHRTRSASQRAAGAFIKGLTAPLVLIALAILALTALPPALRAQTTPATSIKFDGKFGSSDSITASAGRFLIPASKGLLKSASNGFDHANLFHSFHDFQLGSGDTAVFQAPASVRNILARVTGPNASSIDGTLRTELDSDSTNKGSANLFLLNPNGIVFGPNARLDIGGSFAASTADSLNLADGASFNARGSADATLSAAPVTAFGFASNPAGPLSLNGSTLEVAPGKHLALIGGETQLRNAASLSTPDGTTAIFAGSGQGIVPLALEDSAPQFGPITVTERSALALSESSSINVSGSGHQGILIDAGDVTILDGSFLETANTSDAAGADITIKSQSLLLDRVGNQNATGIFSSTSSGLGASGNITISSTGPTTIQDGGTVGSSTYGSGNAGQIALSTESLLIDGFGNAAFTGVVSSTRQSATGLGGNITISSTGAATIQDGGEISASTFCSGNAGQITLTTASLLIDGFGSTDFTGIASNTYQSATGSGGNIAITSSGSTTIQKTGAISASTYGSGNAGQIILTTGFLLIDGFGQDGFTGIGSDTTPSSIGSGGNITITSSGSTTIQKTGAISASTYGSGNAGQIILTTGFLLIDGFGQDGFTGIRSDTTPSSIGSGGNITITAAGSTTIQNAGTIRASTYSSGNAGQITLHSASLLIDGRASENFTGISSETNMRTSGAGPAGNITITARGTTAIQNGGEIRADTHGSGNSGQIILRTASLLIDAIASDNFTGISSDTNQSATGSGGNITITSTGPTTIRNRGGIYASTHSSGNAGQIALHTGSLLIDGFGTTFFFTGISATSHPSATGTGGSITITSIKSTTIQNTGQIRADTYSPGNAGEITLHTGSLLIDGLSGDGAFLTGIYSETAGFAPGTDGSGGNITITSMGSTTIQNSGKISTSTFNSSNAGAIQLNTASLFINGTGAPSPEPITNSRSAASGIFTNSVQNRLTAEPYAAGSAGSIAITALAAATLKNGASINASSGAANAGSISIHGSSVALLQNSTIAAASEQSNAGSVRILSDSTILVASGSSVSSSAFRSAGDVELRAPHQITLSHASVTVEAGSTSPGGDIFIDPVFLILDHATLSANAAAGRGGNITLVADNLFNSSSSITATGTTNGIIDIQSPPLQLSTILASLPGGLLDASSQLRPLCSQRIGSDFSSFLILGRGGLPQAPDEFALLIP